jgi:hypothetical protein
MTTARDIITRALEDVGVVGVGQTPLAEDVNYGLTRLNSMIGQFNRRRWLVFHTKDVVCQTTGNAVYTVGVGADFNVPRPDKLENGCFFRQYTNGGPTGGGDFNSDFNNDFSTGNGQSQYAVDYPLTLIEAREDYNKIALKGMGSWPSFVFYDPAYTMRVANGGAPGSAEYPCGNLFINPVPHPGQFELHILVKDVLQTLANANTVLSTPPEYEEAFEYNLALRFLTKYQITEPGIVSSVSALARASLATIRSANSQVALLSLPNTLIGDGRRYNIYSDRVT